MLTTQFSAGLRAGPLEARPERDASLIWFVTDVRDNQVHSWLHRGGGLQLASRGGCFGIIVSAHHIFSTSLKCQQTGHTPGDTKPCWHLLDDLGLLLLVLGGLPRSRRCDGARDV